jgi:hypothetical protein
MPQASSFADVILEWQQQLDSYARNAEKLTAAEPQRLELEALLKKAFALKEKQQSHTGVRQQTTKEIDELVKTGRELVRRLQSYAKSVLGTDNEVLVDFKVSPRRKRGPRKAKATTKPPETPPSATPSAGASPAQPSVKSSES